MSMARLAFRRGAEYRRHVVVTLDIRFGSEIQITTIGLGLARERVLEILFCLAAF
jgi:hypothetical protein